VKKYIFLFIKDDELINWFSLICRYTN